LHYKSTATAGVDTQNYISLQVSYKEQQDRPNKGYKVNTKSHNTGLKHRYMPKRQVYEQLNTKELKKKEVTSTLLPRTLF
jgi:hypothetical protein